ncbi:MAG: hypothetical protein F6J87_23985 [Spirulina sp. SIO3F2]|nr:hypothetical protein [Spirulina sp. SIO3F2]
MEKQIVQMQSVTLRSRVAPDGFLKVHLPEMVGQEVEAIVVYQVRPVWTMIL